MDNCPSCCCAVVSVAVGCTGQEGLLSTLLAMCADIHPKEEDSRRENCRQLHGEAQRALPCMLPEELVTEQLHVHNTGAGRVGYSAQHAAAGTAADRTRTTAPSTVLNHYMTQWLA